MKTLVLMALLSYQAASADLVDSKPLPFRSHSKPCGECLKVYIQCRVDNINALEESKEVKECQETYYACFNKNHCERGGSQ